MREDQNFEGSDGGPMPAPELPRFAHAQQRYSFFLSEGTSIRAVRDDIGNWVKGDILTDVMEPLVHARKALSEGRISDAAEYIEELYSVMRTPKP